MEELLILGGAVLLLVLLGGGQASATVTTGTVPSATGAAAPLVPLTPSFFSNGGIIPTSFNLSGAAAVSSGYQVAAPSVRLGTFGQVTGISLPSVPAPPPAAGNPTPPYWGGAAGNVGSGGNGLGGSLRAGVSLGTGTTVPSKPLVQLRPGMTFPVVVS